jgi:prepilin-type N-terminal cleavage/methylation domain-containing protein
MVQKIVKKRVRGFTLAELLIALTILAEIATFTIPKVLQSQQMNKFKAIGKENIAMAAAAFQLHQLNGKVASSTKFTDLTQYMNYTKFDTVTPLDGDQGSTPSAGSSCANYACIRLANGSFILWDPSESFGGTNITNVITFMIDPDGKITDGTATGPGHAVMALIYYNGRITDIGSAVPTGVSSAYTWSQNTGAVPPWFSWN